jgi:hypothetical protein
MASVSACAGVSGGVRGLASRRRAAGSVSGERGQREAAGELAQHEPALAGRVGGAQLLERLGQLVGVALGRRARVRGAHRLAGEEEQRLSVRASALTTPPPRAGARGPWRLIAMSPNGSSWRQVASPCL